MTHAPDARVAAVRRFNRFYTTRIGVLRDGLLDSDLSLAEVRVLYELSHRNHATATEIARELALDPGYLSRMLRILEQRGLVQRRRSPDDARSSILTLTRKGRSAFSKLDQRADEEIASLLSALPASDQRSLVQSMSSIERLLGHDRSANPALELRESGPGDMGWILERHGALYASEYGWGEQFEMLVAQIVAQYMKSHDAAHERCWIAASHGERVGSVMLVRESDEVARLRLLLVEPRARGMGVGHRLVDECIRFARAAGYRKITLWTNAVLAAARSIYLANGFRLVREEPHTRFGSEQIGQDWDLDL